MPKLLSDFLVPFQYYNSVDHLVNGFVCQPDTHHCYMYYDLYIFSVPNNYTNQVTITWYLNDEILKSEDGLCMVLCEQPGTYFAKVNELVTNRAKVEIIDGKMKIKN